MLLGVVVQSLVEFARLLKPAATLHAARVDGCRQDRRISDDDCQGDVNNADELQEIYTLLTENYVEDDDA